MIEGIVAFSFIYMVMKIIVYFTDSEDKA